MSHLELIDTHCHLAGFQREGKLESVLERAREAGVVRMVTIGSSIKDWEIYAKMTQARPDQLSWTAGLHPSDVDEDWEDQIAALSTFFATDPVPVGIGEVGLDYFRLPKYPDEAAEIKQRQKEAFAAQLELAAQFDVPVVVHSRSAFQDCLTLVEESPVRGERVVFHCFAEGVEEIQALNAAGGRGSFTGIVTYGKSDTKAICEAALAQGLERLMVETDAPYLAPQPKRGQPNEPAFVAHTARFLAGLFEVEFESLAAQSTLNARTFFRLPV